MHHALALTLTLLPQFYVDLNDPLGDTLIGAKTG